MSSSPRVPPPVTISRASHVGAFDNAETHSINPNDFNLLNISEADKQADDPGAALTGVIETTDCVQDYAHPENPNLTFYDLPGVGTPNFPQATYLEKVNYKQYDFFIIVSCKHFTENDTWLAKEVKKHGKSVFFVRTHVDQDLANERRDRPSTYDETKVLDRIRKNCLDSIQATDARAKVFVICGLLSQTTKFDYGQMVETLLREYPPYKRQAMILTMTMNCKGRA
ncbi:unnamed protein product [Didymodactylos carnosus]|uniref:IRG-type G domain-containing protein n=1 Tax=Didymodactylos carnosus TaxID=1234261 RepID=A0A815WA67_9BILA|nr:unnamed protein product [Didymodactylos carnosus]CAF4401230.1 unnamed protein product [Didymodactylos carnosus]